MTEPNPRFKEQLRRQLRFLRTSCDAYDHAEIDEGVRIAGVARILIHNTGKQTSLLRYMDAESIRLLSTCAQMPPGTVAFIGYGGLGRIVLRDGKAFSEYRPALDNTSTKELRPVSEWWNQVMHFDGRTTIRRSSLALVAADKDGHAHVDPQVTDEYAQLSAPGMMGTWIMRGDNASETPLTNAHLVMLRQMGYELLHSPALSALAD